MEESIVKVSMRSESSYSIVTKKDGEKQKVWL